jgi:hypothetical protein
METLTHVPLETLIPIFLLGVHGTGRMLEYIHDLLVLTYYKSFGDFRIRLGQYFRT